MAPPVLHPLLRTAARVLSMAAVVVHPMVPPAAGGGSGPAADCHAVTAFLQAAAFAGAAAFKARQESRLWQQHQAQRRALGLPPECGWHARVYAGVRALFDLGQPGATVVLTCAMLVTFWQALMVLGGGAQR